MAYTLYAGNRNYEDYTNKTIVACRCIVMDNKNTGTPMVNPVYKNLVYIIFYRPFNDTVCYFNFTTILNSIINMNNRKYT